MEHLLQNQPNYAYASLHLLYVHIGGGMSN